MTHLIALLAAAALAAVPALLEAAGVSPADVTAPPPRAAEPPGGLSRQVAVLGDAVLPGEPLVLRMTWHNTSSKSVECRDDQPLRVTVRKAGEAAARQLAILRRLPRGPAATISLAPGKSFSRKILVVVGQAGDAEGAPAEFVLPAAGKYTLSVEGVTEPAALAVTVAAPASAEDAAACHAWTVEAARCLAVDQSDAAGAAAIEKMCAEHPTSRYAPYAMWAQADELARRGGRRGVARAAVLCEGLLDRHPAFPLREEAFRALVSLYEAMGDGPSARETAEDFARTAGAGELVADLRRTYGESFERLGPPRPAPPSGRAVLAVPVQGSGTEGIPPAVRPAFDAFWKAIGQGDFAALPGMLARDFMSDYGPRSAYAGALAQHRKDATAGQIQFIVTRAHMETAFARPASLPKGEERAWYGNLCVIEGSLHIKWTIPNAVSGDTLDAARACWVLCGYPDGKWRLLSETCPSRNYLIGALAQRVMKDLTKTFTTWRVSDGTRERSPYEEIKARAGLTGKVADERTQWANFQLAMVGPGRQEARIIGLARMLLKPPAGDPAKEVWAEWLVTILLVPGDGDSLILKDLSATEGRMPPSVPSQPPSPGRPPGPAAR
jgi:hypothetical protein